MADEFNPYYAWLGIRPEEQPADLYRLIGVQAFEDNADAISNSADQRMQYLRGLQVGQRGALSQKLLNELSAARNCLLDPKRRSKYDQQLRAKLGAAATVNQDSTALAPLLDSLATESRASLPLVQRARPSARKTQAPLLAVLVGAVGVVVLLMVGLFVSLMLYRPQSVVTTGGDRTTSNIAQDPIVPQPLAPLPVAPPPVTTIPPNPPALPTSGEPNPVIVSDDVPAPDVGVKVAANGNQTKNQESTVPGPPPTKPLVSIPAPPTVSNIPGQGGAPARELAKKASIPNAESLDQAKAQINSVWASDFKAAKTPKAKLDLAKKLRDTVRDTKESATRFALLNEARRLYIDAKDVSSALEMLEAIAQEFEFDHWKQRVKLLEELAGGNLTGPQRADLATQLCDLGYEALDDGQSESAQALAQLARTVATKPSAPEIKQALKEFIEAAAQHRKRFDAVRKAELTLAESPDDVEASLTLGLHYCFAKEDLNRGIPLLAHGGDAKVAVAARAREQKLLGEEAEAWYSAISDVPTEYKAAVQKMARNCFASLATTETGLIRAQAEKRRDELQSQLVNSPVTSARLKRASFRNLPETSPGMVGRLFVGEKDAGWLLTHEPPAEMLHERLADLLAQTKATTARITLEGILSCPTPMSVKFEHAGRSNGPAQVISVDGKQVNGVGANLHRDPNNNTVVQLAAGDHLVQWVVNFDGSNTPMMRILDSGGGGIRFLSLYVNRRQLYDAHNRPTVAEMKLSR